MEPRRNRSPTTVSEDGDNLSWTEINLGDKLNMSQMISMESEWDHNH